MTEEARSILPCVLLILWLMVFLAVGRLGTNRFSPRFGGAFAFAFAWLVVFVLSILTGLLPNHLGSWLGAFSTTLILLFASYLVTYIGSAFGAYTPDNVIESVSIKFRKSASKDNLKVKKNATDGLRL